MSNIYGYQRVPIGTGNTPQPVEVVNPADLQASSKAAPAPGFESARPGEGLAFHNANPVGALEWKRFGEVRIGLKGSQVMAMIIPGDESHPIKVWEVRYPERLYTNPGDAMAAAECHSRCEFHGIESCGLCWVSVEYTPEAK